MSREGRLVDDQKGDSMVFLTAQQAARIGRFARENAPDDTVLVRTAEHQDTIQVQSPDERNGAVRVTCEGRQMVIRPSGKAEYLE
jgi:hypothetical protein